MKKTVVSCAPAGVGRGSNLGMNTVDFAAYNIIKERNLQDRVLLCRPWASYWPENERELKRSIELDAWPMEFAYSLEGLAGGDFDNVLYWGDFQHGKDFSVQSAKRMKQAFASQGRPMSEAKCYEICKRYFMLNEGLDKVSNLGMFGGTLFQNGLNDYNDLQYTSQLERLYTKSNFVRVRDAYSASRARHIRNDFNTSYLSTDAALLNTRAELMSVSKTGAEILNSYNEQIGIFFGRYTKSFPFGAVCAFIRRLKKRMGKSTLWLPWNRFSAGLLGSSNLRLKLMLPSLADISKDADLSSGDILDMLGRVSLIITDTYHVAINAVALGTPCVMVYEPSPSEARNANMGFHVASRDKRALLYMTNDLVDFLLPTTDLTSKKWMTARADHIVNLLSDKELIKDAYSGLQDLAAVGRKEVGDYLERVTGC